MGDPFSCFYSNKHAALLPLSLSLYFFPLEHIAYVTAHRAGCSHGEDGEGILIGKRRSLV